MGSNPATSHEGSGTLTSIAFIMKLIFCVVDFNNRLIEAVVEKSDGKRRVNVRWSTKGAEIPDSWWSSIEGEVDYQDNKASPRTVDDLMRSFESSD